MHKYKGFNFYLVAAIVLCVSQICSADGYGNQNQWGGVGGANDHDHEHDHSKETDYPHHKPGSDSQYHDNGKYQNRLGQANAFSKQTHIEKFGYPINCVNTENPKKACNYFVEISKDEGDEHHLHFELTARPQDPIQGAYVAVGLSEDKEMGEDHIVECIKLPDGRTTWYHSWSTSKTSPKRLEPDQNVIKMEYDPKYEDNLLQCKFKRPIETNVDAEGRLRKFNLIHDKYYVLLATGKLKGAGSDFLGYHGEPQKGNMYAFPESLGNSTYNKYYGGKRNNVNKSQASMNFITFLIVLPIIYKICLSLN